MPPVQTTNEETEEVPAAAEETPGAEGAASDPAPEEPAEEIQIGDKSFATQAEALAYAQSALRESEHQRSVVEAYNAGLVERGGAQAPAPAAQPQAENWEEKFYANPKATLAELKEEIRREVLGTVAGQTEDQKMWAEFNRLHPDLDGFQEDVSAVLNRYDKEIRAIASTKGKEQAMSFLAQKTRAKFEDYAERRKPKRELPNGAGGKLPSSQTNVTKISKDNSEKPLSFIDQVRQNKSKRV
jgi:hypothetical protein